MLLYLVIKQEKKSGHIKNIYVMMKTKMHIIYHGHLKMIESNGNKIYNDNDNE